MVDPAKIIVIINLEVPKCQTTLRNTRAYWLLSKVHQELCLDYHDGGKIVEEGCYILLERRISADLECVKRKDGHRTDPTLP